MTSTALSALRGTAQSSAAANTAPVHEYRCLYTHDLRRKQKRWQDGFLKFHTFNKRVMVYDQPRNYIGDTHWKGTGETLDDGDELTLENGVIVQVAEPVSTTQTDLTPLFEKRPKDAPERPGHGNLRLPQGRLPTPGVRTTGLTANVAPRHKPLSQLLGTPKGPHGRAMLPMRSPFEERQANLQKEDDWAASERAAKRRRVAEAEQTWNSAKETRTPVPKSRETPVFRRERVAHTTPLARKGPLSVAGDLIDLVSDAEDAEPQSDVTMPNTPPGFTKPLVRSRKKRIAASPQVPELPQPLSSPPVSNTNIVVRVQEETELLEKALDDMDGSEAEDEGPPKQSKKLRLATGSRPKMLLCQDAAPGKRIEKNTQIARPERRFGEIPSHEPRKGRVVREPDQYDARRTKRPSEIRKVQNGLTQSSPPDHSELSDGPLALPHSNYAKNQHRQTALAPKADTNTAPFRESLAKDNRQGLADKVLAPKPTSKANRPNLQIRPAAPQDEQISPRHFRRIRSESDKPLGQQSAIYKSFDGLPAENEPKNMVRGKTTERPLQRSTSLNVQALRRPEREDTPPSPIVDTDVGPWSTEAMDLFDWRPPGYVYHGQGRGFGPAEAVLLEKLPLHDS